ncbi:hypothetical protein Micbo1qcDRAFT_160646 [Microdochium bolleyi]|uniref:Uncharacterized protein n=1 Tax=Microdochium bolleyi TaxID=196109 RepID=A0A136J6L0_9PEZI|nr:hypothetical protein Micbo1qcDRAFT_160646 [Microdochium bolleyi]
MAPTVPTWAAQARDLLTSAVRTARSAEPSTDNNDIAGLGPLAARSVLLARANDQPRPDPHKGAVNFHDINNAGMFVLFALIGLGFVITMIWFFFWAKNGGFYFKENDWDDYKSTVLRRKGPNGTLLTGATPSTQLGGGSVYKDYDDVSTQYTGGLTQMTGDTAETGSTLTGITGGVSDFDGREKRRQKRERKEREREKKKDRKNRERSEKKSARRAGEDGGLVDVDAEVAAEDHLRAYRHEKPARVGGINKAGEGSEWDGSTNRGDNSTVSAASELLSNHDDASSYAPPPTSSRRAERHEASSSSRKTGGIRKVYSTADRTADREEERMRSEARRAARSSDRSGSSKPKRDFSFQRVDASSRPAMGPRGPSTIEEEADIGMQGRYLPVGSYAPEHDEAESDLGTKSYRHVIPGLSSSAAGSSYHDAGGSQVSGSGGAASQVGSDLSYQEEKRKRRGQGRTRRE